jgi:hypothetical protein
MPNDAIGGWPALDHLRSAYHNYRVYKTAHYVYGESEDSVVSRSKTNHVHGWLAMLRNKQIGLYQDLRKMEDRIANKRSVEDRKREEIMRKYRQIYDQVEVTLKALEAKARLVTQSGAPNVKDIIRFHEASIENARPRV